ncbi:hypothetical protein BDR04DRAFT_1090563 [Suillus decipiens]|nr:hypothetical protein BDR04DRAFT_1090563 [Suillus decipiens]
MTNNINLNSGVHLRNHDRRDLKLGIMIVMPMIFRFDSVIQIHIWLYEQQDHDYTRWREKS